MDIERKVYDEKGKRFEIMTDNLQCPEPNRIQDYYIAYFDILGYKDFFEHQSEKVPELLKSIHDAIQHTKNHLSFANQSPIMNVVGKIDIRYKIFSDNFFLCMEADNGKAEQIRLLAFLQIIADIQRGFVNGYELFVRGGILKGQVSFNSDYVFGKGLIDVVQMEGKAQYPRIVIAKELVSFLKELQLYSQDEYEQAVRIEKKMSQNVVINSEEDAIYKYMLTCVKLQQVFSMEVSRLTMQWFDGNWNVSYLSIPVSQSALGESFKKNMLQMIQKASPYDYQLLQQPSQDFDEMLRIHKKRVEQQLRRFGNNSDIAIEKIKEAEIREKTLRKYVWVMAYHNLVCEHYDKQDYKIYTKCNCDTRFLKMTIELA